jgi:hypothetical protein
MAIELAEEGVTVFLSYVPIVAPPTKSPMGFSLFTCNLSNFADTRQKRYKTSMA